ncbi:MAG: hypothetical protein ACRDTU_14375, partial [Micromonosporaceae bacterium]
RFTRDTKDTVTWGGAAVGYRAGRYAGHTLGYRAKTSTTLTWVPFADAGQTRRSAAVDGSVLLRVRESEAVGHGLPVETEVRDRVAKLEAPRDHRRQPPAMVRENRGLGMGVVENLKGAEELFERLYPPLAEAGYLPPRDPDTREYLPPPRARGRVRRLFQRFSRNLRRLERQYRNLETLRGVVSESGLTAGYAAASQQPVPVRLVHPGSSSRKPWRWFRAPATRTVLVGADLHADRYDRNVKRSTDLSIVNLSQAADSPGLAHEVTNTRRVNVVLAYALRVGRLLTGNAPRAEGRVNWTDTRSMTATGTVRNTELFWTYDPVLGFTFEHTLSAEVVEDGRRVGDPVNVRGTVTLEMLENTCPPETSADQARRVRVSDAPEERPPGYQSLFARVGWVLSDAIPTSRLSAAVQRVMPPRLAERGSVASSVLDVFAGPLNVQSHAEQAHDGVYAVDHVFRHGWFRDLVGKAEIGLNLGRPRYVTQTEPDGIFARFNSGALVVGEGAEKGHTVEGLLNANLRFSVAGRAIGGEAGGRLAHRAAQNESRSGEASLDKLALHWTRIYQFAADAAFTVRGQAVKRNLFSRGAGEPNLERVHELDGYSFWIREPDMLRLYLEGALDVPTDVVQRALAVEDVQRSGEPQPQRVDRGAVIVRELDRHSVDLLLRRVAAGEFRLSTEAISSVANDHASGEQVLAPDTAQALLRAHANGSVRLPRGVVGALRRGLDLPPDLVAALQLAPYAPYDEQGRRGSIAPAAVRLRPERRLTQTIGMISRLERGQDVPRDLATIDHRLGKARRSAHLSGDVVSRLFEGGEQLADVAEVLDTHLAGALELSDAEIAPIRGRVDAGLHGHLDGSAPLPMPVVGRLLVHASDQVADEVLARHLGELARLGSLPVVAVLRRRLDAGRALPADTLAGVLRAHVSGDIDLPEDLVGGLRATGLPDDVAAALKREARWDWMRDPAALEGALHGYLAGRSTLSGAVAGRLAERYAALDQPLAFPVAFGLLHPHARLATPPRLTSEAHDRMVIEVQTAVQRYAAAQLRGPVRREHTRRLSQAADAYAFRGLPLDPSVVGDVLSAHYANRLYLPPRTAQAVLERLVAEVGPLLAAGSMGELPQVVSSRLARGYADHSLSLDGVAVARLLEAHRVGTMPLPAEVVAAMWDRFTAEAQAAVIGHLTGDGSVPPGFAAELASRYAAGERVLDLRVATELLAAYHAETLELPAGVADRMRTRFAAQVRYAARRPDDAARQALVRVADAYASGHVPVDRWAVAELLAAHRAGRVRLARADDLRRRHDAAPRRRRLLIPRRHTRFSARAVRPAALPGGAAVTQPATQGSASLQTVPYRLVWDLRRGRYPGLVGLDGAQVNGLLRRHLHGGLDLSNGLVAAAVWRHLSGDLILSEGNIRGLLRHHVEGVIRLPDGMVDRLRGGMALPPDVASVLDDQRALRGFLTEQGHVSNLDHAQGALRRFLRGRHRLRPAVVETLAARYASGHLPLDVSVAARLLDAHDSQQSGAPGTMLLSGSVAEGVRARLLVELRDALRRRRTSLDALPLRVVNGLAARYASGGLRLDHSVVIDLLTGHDSGVRRLRAQVAAGVRTRLAQETAADADLDLAQLYSHVDGHTRLPSPVVGRLVARHAWDDAAVTVLETYGSELASLGTTAVAGVLRRRLDAGLGLPLSVARRVLQAHLAGEVDLPGDLVRRLRTIDGVPGDVIAALDRFAVWDSIRDPAGLSQALWQFLDGSSDLPAPVAARLAARYADQDGPVDFVLALDLLQPRAATSLELGDEARDRLVVEVQAAVRRYLAEMPDPTGPGNTAPLGPPARPAVSLELAGDAYAAGYLPLDPLDVAAVLDLHHAGGLNLLGQTREEVLARLADEIGPLPTDVVPELPPSVLVELARRHAAGGLALDLATVAQVLEMHHAGTLDLPSGVPGRIRRRLVAQVRSTVRHPDGAESALAYVAEAYALGSLPLDTLDTSAVTGLLRAYHAHRLRLPGKVVATLEGRYEAAPKPPRRLVARPPARVGGPPPVAARGSTAQAAPYLLVREVRQGRYPGLEGLDGIQVNGLLRRHLHGDLGLSRGHLAAAVRRHLSGELTLSGHVVRRLLHSHVAGNIHLPDDLLDRLHLDVDLPPDVASALDEQRVLRGLVDEQGEIIDPDTARDAATRYASGALPLDDHVVETLLDAPHEYDPDSPLLPNQVAAGVRARYAGASKDMFAEIAQRYSGGPQLPEYMFSPDGPVLGYGAAERFEVFGRDEAGQPGEPMVLARLVDDMLRELDPALRDPRTVTQDPGSERNLYDLNSPHGGRGMADQLFGGGVTSVFRRRRGLFGLLGSELVVTKVKAGSPRDPRPVGMVTLGGLENYLWTVDTRTRKRIRARTVDASVSGTAGGRTAGGDEGRNLATTGTWSYVRRRTRNATVATSEATANARSIYHWEGNRTFQVDFDLTASVSRHPTAWARFVDTAALGLAYAWSPVRRVRHWLSRGDGQPAPVTRRTTRVEREAAGSMTWRVPLPISDTRPAEGDYTASGSPPPGRFRLPDRYFPGGLTRPETLVDAALRSLGRNPGREPVHNQEYVRKGLGVLRVLGNLDPILDDAGLPLSGLVEEGLWTDKLKQVVTRGQLRDPVLVRKFDRFLLGRLARGDTITNSSREVGVTNVTSGNLANRVGTADADANPQAFDPTPGAEIVDTLSTLRLMQREGRDFAHLKMAGNVWLLKATLDLDFTATKGRRNWLRTWRFRPRTAHSTHTVYLYVYERDAQRIFADLEARPQPRPIPEPSAPPPSAPRPRKLVKQRKGAPTPAGLRPPSKGSRLSHTPGSLFNVLLPKPHLTPGKRTGGPVEVRTDHEVPAHQDVESTPPARRSVVPERDRAAGPAVDERRSPGLTDSQRRRLAGVRLRDVRVRADGDCLFRALLIANFDHVAQRLLGSNRVTPRLSESLDTLRQVGVERAVRELEQPLPEPTIMAALAAVVRVMREHLADVMFDVGAVADHDAARIGPPEALLQFYDLHPDDRAELLNRVRVPGAWTDRDGPVTGSDAGWEATIFDLVPGVAMQVFGGGITLLDTRADWSELAS